MGPKLYRVPSFFGSDIPSPPELLTILAVGSLEDPFDPDQQLRIWTPSKFTLLDRAPPFYSNHVLWFTCCTNESWAPPLRCNRFDSFRRPCGWVSNDTFESRLSFNGGAGCKVLDHLHLCRVCFCSSIYLHRMSLNTACNCLLHMNLSIVQFVCLYMHVYLFVSILCFDFPSVFLHNIYLNINICIGLI